MKIFSLVPFQNYNISTKKATNINKRDSKQDGDVTPFNDDLSESEHHQRADDFVPSKKKLDLTTIIQNEK